MAQSPEKNFRPALRPAINLTILCIPVPAPPAKAQNPQKKYPAGLTAGTSPINICTPVAAIPPHMPRGPENMCAPPLQGPNPP